METDIEAYKPRLHDLFSRISNDYAEIDSSVEMPTCCIQYAAVIVPFTYVIHDNIIMLENKTWRSYNRAAADRFQYIDKFRY